MSAIAGFWSWGSSQEVEASCHRMLVAQESYGPHRSAVRSYSDLALGHRLFKLVPEDEFDRQPLLGAGARYILSADIRLDNRSDLLNRLGISTAPGIVLSDADILLILFERYGEAVVDLIVGDFAFAVWDREQRQLTLARDPTGQRPLHYHEDSSFFAFASMPKGLHALDAMPRRPNQERLTQFVGLLPLLGSDSYYEGIKKVEPGHLLTVSNGSSRSRRYWSPKPRELRLPRFEDYRDAFREQLDQAVRSRLRGAAGPVATHLSSGWDSNAVTATAARLLAPGGARVTAYTSVPRSGNQTNAPFGRISDEGPVAAQTASMYPNIDHVRVFGSGASPIARLDEYHEAFDRPIYSLCNFVWLSAIRDQARAQGSRLLLTGELGNWSISAAPYTLLADLVRRGEWRQWGREATALFKTRRGRLRGIAANSFGPWIPSAIWKLASSFSSRAPDHFYTPVRPDKRAEIDRERVRLGGGLAWRPKNHVEDTVRALSRYDYGELRKGALAGWGIDERDPTSDRRLIEFCLSLPLEMLLKDGVRRPLARAALADRVPAAILDQTRKGYQASDWHEGMTNDLPGIRALVDRIARNEEASALIDVEALQSWIRDWPDQGWDDPAVMARYRNAVLIALAAGHFILSSAH